MLIVSLSLIVFAMTSLAVVMGFYTRSYYYSKVYDKLDSIAYSYDYLAISNGDFAENAINAVADFDKRDIAELQIFDVNGQMLCSSYGQVVEDIMPDYENALIDSKIGRAGYKSSAKENVIASTVLIKNEKGETLGAVRCVTSAKGISRQVLLVVLLIFAAALVIISIAFLFCLNFIKGVIKPINNISDAANKIAKGDFKQRIEPAALSEMGELVNNINSMAEELESSEKMKNEFISSVSHELRTPLTAIKGWGETVRMSKDADMRIVDKGIEIIIGETERLSGLVEELLDFSRLQSGRMTFKEERIDILADLSEVVYMYRKPALEKNITLTYNEPVSICTVIGDEARIRQVFINIIDNSIKYNRYGGMVLVEVEQNDNSIKITVADTGIGIRREDVDKVKQKFYRVGSNSSVRGSGIGLAVADEIIKHHNGTLKVTSEENVGTKITITLPTVSNLI